MQSQLSHVAVYLPGKKEEYDGRFRYRAAKDETSTAMGVQAIANLLKQGVDKDSIDALLCFNGMSDYLYPKDVNKIQYEAGLSCPCYTIDTACASFISSVKFGEALLKTGDHKKILILQVMNWLNRGLEKLENNSLLGDGAAALVLEQSGEGSGIVAQHDVTDANHFDFITMPEAHYAGSIEPFSFGKDSSHSRYLVKGATLAAKELLAEKGPAQWFICHHVNNKLVKLWAKAFGFQEEQVLNTFDQYANVSAVNIPLSLNYFINIEPRIKKGDVLFFFAPGAGMHTAAMLYKY